METSVTFPGLAAIVPSARRLVRGVLADSPRAGDMELIASELVSNAIRHTPSGDPGGEFTVTVRTGPDWARVEVSDTGSGEWHPDPDGGSPDDEYGRGLAIIAAVARRGWSEPPRVTLRREVCTAAAGARTEHEFFTRLAQAGVQVRHRHSTVHPRQVTGYAVSFPRHTTKDGEPSWYGGGKLAADLTLPKLRSRWADPHTRDPLAGSAALPSHATRAVLRTTVAEAAGQATGEADFFARLRACGLLVRERYSDLNPGQVTGYAVTLPCCTGPDGAPRWYGGGRLHDRLTLPRLRNAWAQPHRTAEHRGTPRFTNPECAQIYRHAARQAAAATEHLRRCTAGDPDHGADAAWATADALHATAKALHSPRLRCAAAGYDRAARAPYGRIPRQSQPGNQLRTAARLLAMTGAGPGDLTGQVGLLVANLMELADAVAALRQAQAHAAQAAAAREAAEHLHAALTQPRSRRPNFGQAQTRPDRGSTSPGRAQADFPVPLAEALQTATQDAANRRSRLRTRQPPTRARPAR